MNLSKIIKNQRIKQGLTQQQLSFKSEVSVPTIQNIEAGIANPAWSTAMKIFSSLGLKFEINETFKELRISDLMARTDLAHSKNSEKMILQCLQGEVPFWNLKTSDFPSRDQELTWSLILALKDHFPFWVKKNKALVGSFRLHKNQTFDTNRILKFRRLWVDRLAKVI